MPSSYDGDIKLSVSLEPKDAIQSAKKLRGEIEDILNKTSGTKDTKLLKQFATLDKLVSKAEELSKKLSEAQKVKRDFESTKELRSELDRVEKRLKEAYNPDFTNLQKLTDSQAREFDYLTARMEFLKQELSQYGDISQEAYEKATKEADKYKRALSEINNDTRVGIQGAKNRVQEIADAEAKAKAEEEKQKLLEQQRILEEQLKIEAQQARESAEYAKYLQRQVDLVREINTAWTSEDADTWARDIGRDIEIVQSALASLIARQSEVEIFQGTDSEEYSRITDQITEVSNALTNLQEEEQLEADEMAYLIQTMTASHPVLMGVAVAVNNLARGMANVARNALEWAATPITGFLDKLRSRIEGVNKSSRGAQMSFKKMFTMLVRYGLGMRSFFTLFRKLRSAVKEGITNLMQFNGGSNAVASAINSLKASLTSMKNAWGAAFAPIIQMVAPILQTLINMLIDAANAVASFFAALGGQSKVIKATKAQEGLGNALGATGNAAEKAKGQLASFDELNIIQNQNGGGGGGGGAAGAGAGFEYVDVESNMSDLIDKMKESWKNADFTWLGTLLGEKLKGALETSYDFINEKISPFFKKLAKSVATFFNGFIEVDGLADIVGKNIGAAFNAGFALVNTFLQEFHWDSLGTFISQGIISAFKEFDWSNLSEFLSLKVIALMDFIRGAITGVDWKQLPKDIWDAIVEFVSGIDFSGLAESFGELIGAAFSAVGNFFLGAGEDLGKAITDYFTPYVEAAGGDIVLGILNGMLEGIKNIWKWLCENIFNPIYEGFLKFFQIGSPSKLMAQVGKDIIQGLIDGIKSLIDTVVSWVKSIVETIAEKFNSIKNSIATTWKGIADGVAGAWKTIRTNVATAIELLKTGVRNRFVWIRDKISAAWKSIADRVAGAWKTIRKNVAAAIELLKTSVRDKFVWIRDKISAVWTSIKDRVSGAWGNIKTAIGTSVDNIKTAISDKFTTIKTNIADTWAKIKSTAIDTWETIKSKLKEKADAIKSKVLTPFEDLRDGISNAFSTMWTNIKGTINSILYGIEGMANGVVKGINTVIDALNGLNISIPAWVPVYGGKKFSLNLGKLNTIWIPKLAEGAVIPPNKEFIAMLGDQKSGTNIEAPLETIKDAVRDVVGNGNFDEEVVELLQELINVVSAKNLTISKRDIGKAAVEYVRDEKRRTGNTPIFG